jgi:signal transduction histidine kinase
MLPDFRVRQRDYLLEISRALTEELDLPVLLNRILRFSIEMLSGHAGFIALLDGDGWHISAQQGLPDALLAYVSRWLSGQSASITGSEGSLPEISRMLSDISMGMLTSVGIVMQSQRKVIGQIHVFRNYRASFSSNDRQILSSFASQAAVAVRNARLYNQARAQTLKLEALLGAVADGIIILGPDLRVQSVNVALLTLLNAEAEELIGLPYDSVLRWVKTPKGTSIETALAQDWSHRISTESFIEGDIARFGGLAPIPVGINYAPLFDSEGQLLNIIASVRDMTRARTAEELKASFISVVSHELKTPIALIKGYANTLRREDAEWDQETIQSSLKVIENEADRLSAMIEDLLDATRLQAGQMSFKPSEINLANLASEAVRRFAAHLPSHEIEVNFPPDLPLVIADAARIRQVLDNLISNAIKYSPKGKIVVSGKRDGEQLVVCVSDSGKGIDPRDLPHVFERFYRSDEAQKSTKGTGLGLYLCKHILDAHGGKIWVDRTYKEGGRICFSLPLGQSPLTYHA